MKRPGIAITLLVFLVQGAGASGADPAESTLRWSELPPIPGGLGLGGPVAGVHRGALIVAGGANFPDGPPWPVGDQPAGNKVWYDPVLVLERGDQEWRDVTRLPRPLAYAATVSSEDGVYVLGGETHGETVDPATGQTITTNFPVADVLLLRWDEQKKEIEIVERALPALPRPSHHHQAAAIGNVIYVVASHARDSTSSRLDWKAFWSLDLSRPEGERNWMEREPWPGPAREKMAVAVQNAGANERYASPKCLYLFSGATWVNDEDGQPDLARFEHFTDAYSFNPRTNEWRRIADLLDPAGASAAIAVGQSHILLLSGSTGRFITLDIQDNPLFPRDVLAYHTITDTWVPVGEMPLGVVTTRAVNWDGRVVVPSGEIRPGVRTPRVQALTIEPSRTGLGVLNLGVLGLYLAILVGMGLYFSRRGKSTEDYFLAGRRIPWWAAGLSIYATQLSAITFISIPALAYATNWLVFPGQLMIFLMAPVVTLFYLPFFRRLNLTTAYEYLERRFSLAVRLFGSLSFIVFQFGRMAVVVYLPALALSAVTGLDIYACIVLMGVLSTAYTVIGGMEAVIWTDVLQVFVLWGGMLLALGIILVDAGGLAAMFETARADGKLTLVNWTWDPTQMATWIILVGSFALQFGPYTTDQAVIQRYLTTKDERAAARSIWLNGFLTIPFSLLFFTLGSALYVFFRSHPEFLTVGMENDKVFPLFVVEKLPAGFAGLVIAGVFAASMSSLDSSMHSVATVITTDFYRRFRPNVSDRKCLKLARILTVGVGISGTLIALALARYDIKSLFFFFQKLLGMVSSGLVGIFLLGIFTRWSHSTGVLVGAIASFAVLFCVTNYTDTNFYLYAVIGITTSVLVGAVVSLALPGAGKAGRVN